MPVLDDTNEDPYGEYTVAYLIDRTFDLLLGANREEMNRLTSGLDDVTTTFSIDFPPGSLVRGTYMTIDDEVMYVWSSAPSSGTSTVTVQRGMKGTTAAPHDAQALIFTNAYFTRYQVTQTIRDVIRSWAPQVFAVQTVDIPAVNFVRGYDLGDLGQWMFALDCRMSDDTLTANPDPHEWKEISSYRLSQSANLTDFPSGNALFITEPFPPFDQPRTIHFTYAVPINVDTTFEEGDNVIAMGMDASDLDIPPLGAAAQLAMSRELRRTLTEAQGAVADLQQFPPGYAVSAAEKFQERHDQRFNDAVQRLRAQYPMRRTS
jgi:hypothetical protein